MSALLVGYDLKKPGQNYDDLYKALKSTGNWCHLLDSTWIVKTDLSASKTCQQLVKFIDANDDLFVVDITGRARSSYGLSDEITTWITNNV